MNNTILVLGQSGTGKTTSFRNLKPEETFIISGTNKALTWKGSKKQYEKRFFHSTNYAEIAAVIEKVGKSENTKNLIIDDLTSILYTDNLRQALVKGYEKFSAIAHNFNKIFIAIQGIEKPMNIAIICHISETNLGTKEIKTPGKMIGEQLNIPSLVSIMLETRVVDGKGYCFITNNLDGNTLAKSPMGMLPEVMENDLAKVFELAKAYYDEE